MGVTTIIEQGNFLTLPEAVLEKWNISNSNRLYIMMSAARTMRISTREPIEPRCVISVDFSDKRGIFLPPIFLRRMGLKAGNMIEITLSDCDVFLRKM